MATRREYYATQGWDGICVRCAHDYIACADSGGLGCTCLACAAQYQDEQDKGLSFDEPEGGAV